MNEPTVSIILPTYNRAAFLPEALASIRAQTFTDWELIIVDDGSTDETKDLIARLTADVPQQVYYLYQHNQGAYGARNTGLDHAAGKYVAFYDSDDQWLPHHLARCVAALDEHRDVDWVYGACRIVDQRSGGVISPNSFYENGAPRPFLRLRAQRTSSGLSLIDDHRATRCMISHGFYCGLQNSLLRRSLFDESRFEAANRNEAEDQLIVIRALAAGRRFAYYDDVHVVYRVHDSNSTSPGSGGDPQKLKRVITLLIEGYERLSDSMSLSGADRRALQSRLARAYFWQLGYSVLWMHGNHSEALVMFEKGMRLNPLSLRFWKTYLLARARMALRL